MSKPRPEYPLLAIDTSSRRTWVGLKLDAHALAHRSSTEDPSKSLFALVAEILAATGVSLDSLSSIAFCSGPGSMLGARAACMTIRSWRGIGIEAASSLYSYTSLELGALLVASSPYREAAGLIATDARRNSWNTLPVPLRSGEAIQIVTNEALESEIRPLITFAEFPRWTRTNAQLRELSYDPAPVFADEAFHRIVKPEAEATPLSLRQSDFKKWIPKIHTAPTQ